VISPEAAAEGTILNLLKEFTMNQAPELEVVELGDAKAQTKGFLALPAVEDNPARPTRQPL
jgi:hypothetical protein